MISLLVYVLLLFLVFGAIFWVVERIPIPDPFHTVVLVVLGLILVLALVSLLLGGFPLHDRAMLQ